MGNLESGFLAGLSAQQLLYLSFSGGRVYSRRVSHFSYAKAHTAPILLGAGALVGFITEDSLEGCNYLLRTQQHHWKPGARRGPPTTNPNGGAPAGTLSLHLQCFRDGLVEGSSGSVGLPPHEPLAARRR